jgi:peptidoglycan hydrolase-like protein with peptidoglycan-binding domain/GH25 family lysozyme M1 (1,4-beta-N-acetylmuramidase)
LGAYFFRPVRAETEDKMAISVIGGASIDEYGHAHGGKAGDQTGREVGRKSWYKHPKKWFVIRPNAPKDAETIATTMEALCDNDNIGYDQYQRTTMLKAGMTVGWDASRITETVECDCSKAVQFCCFATGIPTGKWDDGFRTGNMIPVLLATGRFTKLSEGKYINSSANLKRGDILVTQTAGHTAVVLTDGVNITRSIGDRPLMKGASGADVEQLQTALKTLGYGNLLGRWGEDKDGVDGDYGDATAKAVKAFEHDNGLTQNGVANLACIKAILAAVAAKSEAAPTTDDEDGPDDSAPDDMPDDTTTGTGTEALPSYMCLWAVATASLNVRTGPGTSYAKKIALYPGTGLMYDGETRNGWHAVLYRGTRHWVSSKYSRLETREKYILDLSVYDDVNDWATLARYVSFLWLRVACRRKTATGEVYIDGKFKQHAAACVTHNIPFGVYVYGRAATAASGVEEAQKAVAWAEPYNPANYMYDIEAPTLTHASCAAFLAEAVRLTGKPVGIYVGHHWSQVNAGQLQRAFTVCPYYRDNGGGTHGTRNPSHAHDVHQYTCSSRIPGKSDDTDVSHINTDLATNGTGHDVLWFRSGGKASV